VPGVAGVVGKRASGMVVRCQGCGNFRICIYDKNAGTVEQQVFRIMTCGCGNAMSLVYPVYCKAGVAIILESKL
jgi:hypothetical protein